MQRASQKNTVQQLVMTGNTASQGDVLEAEEVVSLLLDDAEMEAKIKEQVSKAAVSLFLVLLIINLIYLIKKFQKKMKLSQLS